MSKKFIKKILTNTGPKTLFSKETRYQLNKINSLVIKSFGKLNKNKIFYVIKRSPGAGMFSNLTFVMNHLLIAQRHNFIPVVDMENYPTIYNEKKKINGTKNAWEYYFEPVSKYSLNEVYKSQNVFITSDKFENRMTFNLFDKKFLRIKKKIKIKKNILKSFKKHLRIKFNNEKKILGVHFRGTTYKVAKSHAFPLNKSLMKENIDNLIKRFKYKKIFLVTDEEDYINFFKKNYKDKLIYCEFFRTKKIDQFKVYPRKFHRYKLGKEIIIETLMLAKCEGFTYVKSNVSSAAIFFSKKKPKLFPRFIGNNSRNKYIARWLWYFKNLLPRKFGGHDLKINN